MGNFYTFIVGNPQGKRPFGGRYEVNNKMDLEETGYEDMYWIKLAQNMVYCRAVKNTVMNFGIP
jgi:hypothetical protein